MAMETISATELARNTRQILDRIAVRGETVLVERNHVTIAKIAPPEVSMTAEQALAGLRAMLTPRQGAAWQADSRDQFGEALRDPWE
jgi:antitoxin (DNA-binding transcriptional repressor) of toxin-antitoxin stability system